MGKAIISSMFFVCLVLLSISSSVAVNNQKGIFTLTAPKIHSSVITGGSSLSSSLFGSLGNQNSFELVSGVKSSAKQWQVSGTNVVQSSTYPLGVISGTTKVSRSYTVSNQVQYQSIAIRFRVHLVGAWTGQTFLVYVNGDLVFSTPLTGSNIYKDIEIQIPAGQNTIVELTFGCSASTGSFSWSITDVGVYMNQCPEQYGYDQATGQCVYAGQSIYYFLYQYQYTNTYSSQSNLPSWFNMIANGQTNSGSTIYNVANNDQAQAETQEANNGNYQNNNGGAVVGSNNQGNQNGNQGNNNGQYGNQAEASENNANNNNNQGNGNANNANLIIFIIELVGNNFDFSKYTSNGQVGTTNVNGVQVLGPFSLTNTLTRNVAASANTQSVIVRFRLYLIGLWINQPLTVAFNGVSFVLSNLQGNNTYQDIELQFPASANYNGGLTFGQGNNNQTQGNAQWAISDIVIVLSVYAVGVAPTNGNATTNCGSNCGSFMTPLLNGNTYKGSFPNATQQPSWLAKVLTGSYTPQSDVFGVNGNIVPTSQVVGQLGNTASGANLLVYIIQLVGQIWITLTSLAHMPPKVMPLKVLNLPIHKLDLDLPVL